MKDYRHNMRPDESKLFQEAVVGIVRQIPYGYVTTYGMIAAWAGWPNQARLVGRVLRYADESSKLPCHRVVNSVGRLVPGWKMQYNLLVEEGVTFQKSGRVNMKRHLWVPESDI